MAVLRSMAYLAESSTGRLCSPPGCLCQRIRGNIQPHHKSLNRMGNVLQLERPELLESEVEPAMHMIAHRPRDADATRRTLSLESGRHIHCVPCRSVPSAIASPMLIPTRIGWLDQVVDRRHGSAPALHLHGAAHRSVDAIEHDEQRVTAGLDDPATMLRYRWVYQVAAESPQPLESPASSRPMSRL